MTLEELDRTGRDQRPLAFDAMVARYEPEVMDLVGGSARIRLRSSAVRWDVELGPRSAALTEVRGNPDATISAEDETWRRIALKPETALGAFRRGRLRIERNLHLGVGFLAATS